MTSLTEVPLIPRHVLFGNPVRTSPKLSPDGKFLSIIAPRAGVLNIWLGKRDADLDTFQPITNDTVRGVRQYFWAQTSEQILYLQDVGGDENWRLYSVDLASNEVRDLTPFENVQVQVVDVSKRHPTTIIIGVNKDNVQAHDLYALDIISGELTKILENPGTYVDFGVDANQQVRTVAVSLPDGGSQLLVRDHGSPESEWSDFITWGPDDALLSGVAGFSGDSQSVYLRDSTDVNAGRLTERSLDGSGSVVVLLEDPLYDVAGLIQHPDTFAPQAAAITRDKTEWTFFDPSFEADFNFITTLVSGELSLASRDGADQLWLIAVINDTRSREFYIFDRVAKSLKFLFSVQPDIDGYTLSSVKPINFESRDGFTIHGYLTTPSDVDEIGLPLVLNVHGGPWARDVWGLQPEAQWMANRGYAVLQVNFRSSTGYGKAFLNAGNHEWGGKMHDDLVDAVNWAIAEGIADPKKVAIYGGSYGGYAALVGATFTPDLFRCAVDIVGPSNLITFINSIPPYWSAFMSVLKRRVGDIDTQEEFLKSRSPLFKVDQIKIPLLIAQGANDPRVKQTESEQIVEALKQKGLDYEYLLFPDEGHGFARPENRLKFYAAAELFLSKHLGGRFER